MKQLFAWVVALAPNLTTTPTSADEMLVDEGGDDVLEVEEEEEDEFGHEVVWIDARAGYTFLNMVTFDAADGLLTAGLVPTGAGGATVAMGLGVRLWFVTLGPRVTLAMLNAGEQDEHFNIWSVDGEIGLRIPLGRVEPHLTFAVGYSAFGGIDDAMAPIADGFDIEGANLRMGLGVDVYITEYLSVGVDVTGEVLALSRPGVPLEEVLEAKNVGTLNEAEAEILEADGASTGAALSLLGGLGVHF